MSIKVMNPLPAESAGETTDFAAADLIADRLATLSSLVSRGLARLYSVRFGLTISDWRVLAVISRYPGVSSNAVCELAAMDKMRVSRAVSGLLETGRIHRRLDKQDRRRGKLYLTDEGRDIHAQVVPVARAYEAKLMAGLTDEEARLLERLLASLESSAQGIAREGFGMAVGLNPKNHGKSR